MTTLISYHSSDGSEGRCDARCYDAKHETCNCVCGGRNHGAGKEQAMENTREMATQWIESAIEDGSIIDGQINPHAYQLSLLSFLQQI